MGGIGGDGGTGGAGGVGNVGACQGLCAGVDRGDGNDCTDCPKSHVCKSLPNSQFCVRVNPDGDQDLDCSDLGAPWCADIDGDGSKECAGSPLPNELPPAPACLNSSCSGSTPVCEVAATSNLATCGEYGLCQVTADCASGFDCVGLWPDGRMECVELGGTRSYITDCPDQQVCAAPRLAAKRGISPDRGPAPCNGFARTTRDSRVSSSDRAAKRGAPHGWHRAPAATTH